MRDYLIAGIIFGSLPLIIWRPYIGVLMWSWVGYMNPHRLAYGFAYDYPFAYTIAVATLIGLVFTRESRRVPVNGLTMVWLAFILWMCLTTVFALNPDPWVVWHWERAMKIQVMALITLMLMKDQRRMDLLVWAIVISLGFFGIKGGLFSVLTGGEYKVFGPANSFIYDNNALALAMIITLPLMRYLQLSSEHWIVRQGLTVVMLLTALAILTSHSRGAFLAGAAMAFFFFLKSPRKLTLGLAMLIALPILLSMMPEAWFERMETIQTYDQDASAMGRINAWWFAWNLALDHPLVGGGFMVYEPEIFARYAPVPNDFHDSHSIFFEVLAEHGFVGLALFVTLGILALRYASWVVRHAKDRPELTWARNLAAMCQVSLIGYAVGGAFLGLAYFDLYYHLVAMIVLTRMHVQQVLATEKKDVVAAGVPPIASGTVNLPAGRDVSR